MWIKTLTIVSDSSNKNDFVNTYPISIGLKSAQHDIVEIEYLKEYKELSHGINTIFYCMEKKRNTHVYFEVIESLGYHPERISMNGLMLGNSTYIPRFRYAANIKELAPYLYPCDNCLYKIKKDNIFLQVTKIVTSVLIGN